MRRTLALTAALAAMTVASAAAAHTAWLERTDRPNVYRLMFGGHEGRTEPAVADRLREVNAVDARGRRLTVRRTMQGAETRLAVSGQPSLIWLHYDNGINTRPAGGGASVRRPMNEVPGALSAVNAQKHGKFVARWSPVVARPVGQPFEVTPLSAAQPRAGEPMRVRVTQDGRPAQGVAIGRGEDTAGAFTDADGVGVFVPDAGENRLWAGRRIPVTDNPAYTQLSYEYLLVFEAR